MKNIIISALSTKIIVGMSFWFFQDTDDIIMSAIAIFLILWISIETIDEWITNIRRERRRKKRQVERFKLEVIDLTERKVAK